MHRPLYPRDPPPWPEHRAQPPTLSASASTPCSAHDGTPPADFPLWRSEISANSLCSLSRGCVEDEPDAAPHRVYGPTGRPEIYLTCPAHRALPTEWRKRAAR